MLRGWRIKHVGTVDRRRSATGTTIAPGSILPTGTTGGAPTAIRATKVFRAIAATEVTIATVETIATNEIIGTIGADVQATFRNDQAAFKSLGRWHRLCRCRQDGSPRSDGGASRIASRLTARFKRRVKEPYTKRGRS